MDIGCVNLQEPSDSTPPVYTILPFNETTTNESVKISFTTDESANESNNTMGVYPSFVGVWSSLNQTLGTAHSLFIANLSNGTRYNFNTTAYDIAGNLASANFSFVTALNPHIVADTCTYTSGDWNVLCSDNCVISSTVIGDVGKSLMVTGSSGFFKVNARIHGFGAYRFDKANNCDIRLNGNIG